MRNIRKANLYLDIHWYFEQKCKEQYDINDFNNAGGVRFLISSLLDAGLLHSDVKTVVGLGLHAYIKKIAELLRRN